MTGRFSGFGQEEYVFDDNREVTGAATPPSLDKRDEGFAAPTYRK